MLTSLRRVLAASKTWGTTAEERALPFPPAHDLAVTDDRYFRGVSVAAPPGVVVRWLCQLRAAPYRYDWIDNFGRRSPQTLTRGLEALATGQRFMRIFDLVAWEPDRSLTLVLRRRASMLFGCIAVTYLVLPVEAASCRLIARLDVRSPRGPLGWMMRRLLPPGDLVMMRRQLLNLKALAERDSRASPAGEQPR